MIYQHPHLAIDRAKEYLYQFGQEIEQERWQSTRSPDNTWELLNHSFGFIIPDNVELLRGEVKPNLPWADDHFWERVGGEPLNPPPSSDWWPFATKKAEVSGIGSGKAMGPIQYNEEHKKGGIFSHTYPERFWPKYANKVLVDANKGGTNLHWGIRFKYGDYSDIVRLLANDPSTRQAYLPIWFPEDTGVVHGERVPCTLGYHLIIRNKKLHIIYYIRSCDIIRHFRDDIYMACLLVYDVIGRLKKLLNDLENPTNEWVMGIEPGSFTMHITSLHCFLNEKELLKTSKI